MVARALITVASASAHHPRVTMAVFGLGVVLLAVGITGTVRAKAGAR